MNFTERKALVEEFLRKDPTDYKRICLYIADDLYKNATHAKELYGLPCDIPMCLVHRPAIGIGHIYNAVLLGNNKSDIEQWGWINREDYVALFDKNATKPFKDDEIDYLWGNGSWIIQDERYRLTNYSIGFDMHWEPNQKPNITVIPTYPREYQDIIPA